MATATRRRGWRLPPAVQRTLAVVRWPNLSGALLRRGRASGGLSEDSPSASYCLHSRTISNIREERDLRAMKHQDRRIFSLFRPVGHSEVDFFKTNFRVDGHPGVDCQRSAERALRRFGAKPSNWMFWVGFLGRILKMSSNGRWSHWGGAVTPQRLR